jgi:hypothetical protein
MIIGFFRYVGPERIKRWLTQHARERAPIIILGRDTDLTVGQPGDAFRCFLEYLRMVHGRPLTFVSPAPSLLSDADRR